MTGDGEPTGIARTLASMRALLYHSSVWRLWLRRGAREQVTRQAEDRITGNSRMGDALFGGTYTFQGQTVVAREHPLWEPDGVGAGWLEDLHGFLWIRHLRAAGSELASRRACALIESWLDHYTRWHPHHWRPDILGDRVAAWILHADFLLNWADDAFRSRFETALTAQVRHLAHVAKPGRSPARLLPAARGLVLSSLLMSGGEARRAQADQVLALALESMPGHDPLTSPAPSDCIRFLEQLITLRGVLLDCGEEMMAASVTPAVRETAACLGTCVLGDHRLARFHGGVAGEPDVIRRLVNASRDAGEAAADGTGYRRMSSGGTTVLADFGLPQPGGCAGPLAFEMSDAGDRLIVSAWSNPERPAGRRRGPAGIAAHSTLAVADDEPRLHRRRTDDPLVSAERSRRNDGEEITGLHRGYESRFGLTHGRRLALTHGGRVLTGTDTLTGRRERPYRVRFHLHPRIQPIGGGHSRSVWLNRSGRMWEFRFEGDARLTIEPSVYEEDDGTVTDTWQLVLTGRYRRPISVLTWTLARSADV